MRKTLSSRWPALLALALCLVLSAGCGKAAKARRLLAAANSDFQAQKYDAAELEYRSARRLAPLDPTAIRQLGFIFFDEGRPQEAFAFLKKSLEQDPKNTEVQLKMAELYGGSRNFKEAADLLGSVLRSDPANEHALVLLAEISPTNSLPSLSQRLETQLREGGQGAAACRSALGWIDLRMRKPADAEAEFQKASALDPKLATPYLGQATLCAMRKDLKGVGQALQTAAKLSPVRSNARMKYAEFKAEIGADAEAKEILRDITRQAPDYIPAWLSLMKMYFAERQYDECQTAVDSVLARDKFNFEALLQSGDLALARREAAKSLSDFQRMDEIFKKGPQAAQVKYHLALAYLLNNEKQKGMANLNETLALDSSFSAAALLLAELDFRSGNLTESVTLLTQLIKKHPDNAQARLTLAEAYLAQKRPDRALEVYQQMAKMFPKNPEIPRRMGMVYESENDLPRARAALEKSLELAPDYTPALEQITGLDVYEKQFAQAHRRLAGVMEKTPKEAEPLLLQGDVYLAESQTNQAESSYSKAIELNPEMPAAYLCLARLYEGSHQEEKALSRLKNLLDKTNDPSAMLMIGVIHQTMGQYEQARDAYQKLLLIDPKNGGALNNLAYVDSEFLGDIDKGLQAAQTARDFYPNDPYTADTLGWILYKKREYPRALSLIQESAEKQPNNPEVQMHLGLAYYMMEEEKPARICLQRAVAGRGDFPGKELARRRLAILDINPANATPAVIDQLQAALREDPLDPVPLSLLASIHEQRGEAPQAAQSLESLLKINPQNWQAMLRLSRLYADRLDDPRKALELAKSAHSLAPDDGRASALLGELAFRIPDYPWALSLLEQAANQSSDQPALDYHLALAYYAVGRVADADAAMQKAARQNSSLPELDQAKQFLTLRAAVKDPAQAQAAGPLARQILDKNPNYVPALMVSALLAERRGATDEARQTWQKALSIYPLFIPATRQLALLYSRSPQKSDQDQAYDLAEKARASYPNDLELAKTLGLLAYNRGDYNRSMPLLKECADKSGADGVTDYYLGMDYYKLKQQNQCKQALKRALELRVPDNLAASARGVLAELK